jgi:hypothetical protein
MYVITLLSLLALTSQAFRECPRATVPFTVVGQEAPLQVLAVHFSQARRDGTVEVTIRNNGVRLIHGALLQVELLDQRHTLLVGYRINGSDETRPPAPTFVRQLAPLLSYARLIGGESWDQPLGEHEERTMEGDSFLFLPTCAVTVNVSLYAALEDDGNWHRISDTILRQTATPDDVGAGAEEKRISALRRTLPGLADVALIVRVDETGRFSVLDTAPALSSEQRSAVEELLRGSTFSPAIDRGGPVSDEMVILLRFCASSEQFFAPLPDLPERFAKLPLLKVGVGPDQLSIRRRY